ncbi:hypothetical protein [Polynucleobacter antarcticus]|uniref:MetA-pathway of phenol degradation n=1 Tax=Polynucleobacter antarcticus TaxID=1743162 RepID=A0A6M9PU28_9BURK|nr:hypothetical protein [Polynucleobacter antarcticus]QKM62377.1 hypothetical protein DCO16_04440 [Polynucleobacter antarcticus]
MRLYLLTLLFIPVLSYGFEPLNTDDAGTVKKSSNQIEQYFFKTATHGHNTVSSKSSQIITPGEEYFGVSQAQAFPFTYTRGLTENIEASIGASYFATPRGSYSPISNKVIAIKWRFLEAEDGQWALAIKPSLTLPGTGQQQVSGIGLALPNYGVNLIGSHYLGDIEIHVNASYTKSLYNTNYLIATGPPENRTNIIFASVAPVWKVSKSIKLALDTGLETNPPISQQYLSNYALLATIISINDDLDLGLSYMRSAANMGVVFGGTGISASRSDIGFTWRFQ